MLITVGETGRMANGKLHHWFYILFSLMIFLKTGADVDLTLLQTAVEKGAVCLDGSPPGYNLDKGSGEGINNWLVHIEGGGWCNDVKSCQDRAKSHLGTSNYFPRQSIFHGILSNNQQNNPDFYSWNRVKVRYCDGASFTGDVEAVDPATNLHFRGARIFAAVMEDLLAKGMANAQKAVLSGSSAGGLTTILHCDSFRNILPLSTKVKCVSDGGFFVHVKDISGAQHIQDVYREVVDLHGSAKNLPASCTSKMDPHLCFFPQYAAQQSSTPIFFVNPAYDAWQIKNIFIPRAADPSGSWYDCKLNLANCSPSQLQTLQGFRSDFLSALTAIGNGSSRGYFVDGCYSHCQTEIDDIWWTTTLNGKSIANAVGDWFYDRSPFQEMGSPYPNDKTCQNMIFTAQNDTWG